MIQKHETQWLSYLLHSEQHHFLFSHLLGEQLKAEQHIRGRDCVQGVGRQKHALESVLPHLTSKILFIEVSAFPTECGSPQEPNLCQSQVVWFDSDAPRYRFKDFSSARILLAHTHRKLQDAFAKLEDKVFMHFLKHSLLQILKECNWLKQDLP